MEVAMDSSHSTKPGKQTWVLYCLLVSNPGCYRLDCVGGGTEFTPSPGVYSCNIVSVAFRPLPEVCGSDDKVQRSSGGLP